MVAVERLKLENADLRRRAGRHDPRVGKLEDEVRRLREQVELARAERDDLRSAIQAAVEQLRRG
jgi:predicted  nucleic acid-binding Zn-ribbon protein